MYSGTTSYWGTPRTPPSSNVPSLCGYFLCIISNFKEQGQNRNIVQKGKFLLCHLKGKKTITTLKRQCVCGSQGKCLKRFSCILNDEDKTGPQLQSQTVTCDMSSSPWRHGVEYWRKPWSHNLIRWRQLRGYTTSLGLYQRGEKAPSHACWTTWALATMTALASWWKPPRLSQTIQ